MPYGTVSPETVIWLREAGLDMAWHIDEGVDPATLRTVDITISGALDESFLINDLYDAEDIARCIGTRLKLNGEINDWEVVVYRSGSGDPYLAHWSQHPEEEG